LDSEIANLAVKLALSHRGQTRARLARLRPELGKAHVDEYDRIAHDAVKTGCLIVYRYAEKFGRGEGHRVPCRALIATKLPWVSAENADRIFGEGMYLAFHDGIGG
jgi:hypothetical protein